MTGIYKITNPYGLVYIGQAIDIAKRWRQHGRGKMKHGRIGQSFLCYPREFHKFEVIHELPSDVSREVLNTYERLYIQAYGGTTKCLNKTIGGQAWPQKKNSAETRQKISQANKGRVWSEAHKRNVSFAVAARNRTRRLPVDQLKINTRIRKPTTHFGFDSGRAVIVLHKEYGIFYTLRDAAKVMGMSEQWMGQQINGTRGNKNKTPFIKT